MKIKNKLKLFTIGALLFFSITAFAIEQEAFVKQEACFSDNKVLNDELINAKQAVVSIDINIFISAYGDSGRGQGTGFIIDKKNGLIVTNSHVTGSASIGEYMVAFHTGQQAKAKVVYYDLWQDFAILKVPTEQLPETTTEIIFSKDTPEVGQKVFIIGNNEGEGFSVHQGSISKLYSINGQMPQESYIISLNSVGGSSGSPLLNKKGEALGIHFGGGKTFGISLKGKYISHALNALKSKKEVKRQHIGIITELYSLEDAVRHQNFPREECNKYLEEFPNALNNAITIVSTIPGSPAENLLRSRDIIWKINGKKIGPNLYKLDHLMNNSSNEKITLTIYRNGEEMDIEVKLYDINANKIRKMIQFAGAVFCESDDISSAKTGIPLSSLAIFNLKQGSFYNLIYSKDCRIIPYAFGNHKLTGINKLAETILEIVPQKYTTFKYKNMFPYGHGMSNGNFKGIAFSRDTLQKDITFSPRDFHFEVFKYNPGKLEWEIEQKLAELNN